MRRLAVPFLMTASMTAPAAAQVVPKKPVFRNPPRPPVVKPRPKVPDRMEVPGGYIKRDANDSCRKYFKSSCPEGARCNPPRPQWVACPPELLNWAKPGEKVERRDDGTCHVYYNVTCPEGATCNPPPPKRVRCPDDMPSQLIPPKPPQSQPTSTQFAPPPPPAPTK